MQQTKASAPNNEYHRITVRLRTHFKFYVFRFAGQPGGLYVQTINRTIGQFGVEPKQQWAAYYQALT